VIASHGLFYLFFLTVALLFTGYKVFIKSPSNKVGFYGGDIFIQFLTVGKILVHYIKLLFYPVNLLADYSFNSFPLSQSIFEPATFLSLLILCVLGVLAVKLLLINRLMGFAVIWFFVTLLPVCHIFPHHELLAEHYLYLPSFGFVLLIALILDQLLAFDRWRYVVYTVFAIVLVLLSTRTINRNYDWKDSFSLWSKTVETAPNCARALSNLGMEYYKLKEYSQAEQLYQRAISIRPGQDKPYSNLGNLYRVKKDYSNALVMYKKAVQLNPANCTHYNTLGHAYAMVKNFDQAVKAFEQALECKPNYAEAYNNLGNVYRGLKDADRAITCYQKAIQLNHYYSDAHHNLAKVYGDLNQHEKSIQVLKGLLSKNPLLPDTVFRLGKVYEKTTQYDQAIAHYQKALEIDPGFLDPHLNLARLYLEERNDKQKALHHLKRWLANAPQDDRAESIRKVANQIERGRVN
jgi:tetratricopeptide (TPR) repeat protein